MSCESCSTARQEPSLARATRPSHEAETAATVKRGLGSGRRMNSSASSRCGAEDDEEEVAVGIGAPVTEGGRLRGGGNAAAAAEVIGSCCASSRVGTGSRGGTGGGCFTGGAAGAEAETCDVLCCCDESEKKLPETQGGVGDYARRRPHSRGQRKRYSRKVKRGSVGCKLR